MAMRTTEIIALDRLEQLKKKLEEERKQAAKKKPLHRMLKPDEREGGPHRQS